jgi:hypothetical protein
MEKIVLKIRDERDNKSVIDKISDMLKSGTVKVIIENQPEKVTDRIKTLEDALEETWKTMPDFSVLPEEMRKQHRALFCIEVITEALNEGWKPDWHDEDQRKWIPWFYPNSSSGFVFRNAIYHYSAASAGNGLHLCFKSDELARYAGTQFTEFYKEFIL